MMKFAAIVFVVVGYAGTAWASCPDGRSRLCKCEQQNGFNVVVCRCP